MSFSTRFVAWLIFGCLTLIWGSSFLLMKLGLHALTAYQVAAIRIASAGLVLLPLFLSAWRRVDARSRAIAVASGFLGSFFPAFLFCLAETKIDSSLAGLLNAFTPLFTLIISSILFKQASGWWRWVGVLLGLLGLVLLFVGGGKVNYGQIQYSSLVLLATSSYGLNVNIISKYLKQVSPPDIAALSLSSWFLPSIIVLYYTGFFQQLYEPGIGLSIFFTCILGCVGTAIASVLFFKLVQYAGPVFASTVTYCIPFVALTLGWLDDEPISLLTLSSLAIILTGVYLANKKALPVK